MMRVLILDRTHNVLCEGDQLPEITGAGARPLRTIESAFRARGLELPAPAGSRPCDGGRDFAFVIDRVPAPEGLAWRSLRHVASDEAIWDIYVELMLGGWQPPARALDVWSFGSTRPELASQLAHLVACGQKRVTMGWLEWSERLGVPVAYEGGVSVVTDGFGYPRLVLRTVAVKVVPFEEVDEASAVGEGEGDLTYGDWRDSHVAFFGGEAERLGLTFGPRSKLAVERFEVLHVVGRAG